MFTTLPKPELSEDLTRLFSPLRREAWHYERQHVTPMHAVYEENKLTVWKVHGKATKHPPLLLIPALINRSYILDLDETHSLCKELSELGYPVYLVDWGIAGPEDRWCSFSDLFTGPLDRIVRRVTRLAGQKPVLFGYCLGGIVSNIYTSIFPDKVAGLIAMTAPVDFSKAGIMALWTQKKYLDPETLVDAIGNVPPALIQNGFVALKPAQFLKKWRSAWDKQDSPEFLESFLTLEYWVNDNVPFPGGIWEEYIGSLYQDNLLHKDELWIGPHHASLSKITCPVLNIVADNDHIVPPDSALPLNERVSSKDQQALHLPGGHVGIIASSRLFPRLVTELNTWLEERDDVFSA